MKRLLLVLMLLCVFIPVNAKGTAFVYKKMDTETGMYTDDGISWETYKKNHTGYLIVEPNDNNTASVWPIDTWTGKDPNGKKQNYYEQEDMMTFGFLRALVGNNTVWIIAYADEKQNFMFSGTAKPVKIGTTKPAIAATLSGTMLRFEEDDPNNIDVRSGKISLSLNTLLTTYSYINSGEDTVDHVVSYLENTLKYKPGTED